MGVSGKDMNIFSEKLDNSLRETHDRVFQRVPPASTAGLEEGRAGQSDDWLTRFQALTDGRKVLVHDRRCGEPNRLLHFFLGVIRVPQGPNNALDVDVERQDMTILSF